jgi:hypothetical protein
VNISSPDASIKYLFLSGKSKYANQKDPFQGGIQVSGETFYIHFLFIMPHLHSAVEQGFDGIVLQYQVQERPAGFQQKIKRQDS